MTERDYFQKYMPGDVCFGCGGDNPDGLQIQSFWEGDDCVCVWRPRPEHQGWAGLTCGGIIATLIDCHCMASAMATAIRNEGRPLGSEPHYRFATGTLTIKYLKPTPIDVPLRLRARVTAISGRKYTLHCDVFAGAEKTVEAEAIAILVYRSDQAGAGDSRFSVEG